MTHHMQSAIPEAQGFMRELVSGVSLNLPIARATMQANREPKDSVTYKLHKQRACMYIYLRAAAPAADPGRIGKWANQE